MQSTHILKVLANGWQVPYPEEAFYRDNLLLLKDYRLSGMPGKAWPESCSYEDYLDWLQDYLFQSEITLTSKQKWIPEKIDTDTYFSCASIGWHAGFCESVISSYPQYAFPENFEETLDINHLKGIIHDDPYAEFVLGGYPGDVPPPDRLEFILLDYGGMLLKKKDEEQFQRLWPGFVKLEPLHWMSGMTEDNLEPADSAWRVYLSLILKKIKNRTERIVALDRFFIEYADILHK